MKTITILSLLLMISVNAQAFCVFSCEKEQKYKIEDLEKERSQHAIEIFDKSDINEILSDRFGGDIEDSDVLIVKAHDKKGDLKKFIQKTSADDLCKTLNFQKAIGFKVGSHFNSSSSYNLYNITNSLDLEEFKVSSDYPKSRSFLSYDNIVCMKNAETKKDKRHSEKEKDYYTRYRNNENVAVDLADSKFKSKHSKTRYGKTHYMTDRDFYGTSH